MARKLRIQYPGAIYHAMSRGDHQERIFSDDTDRQQFLSTLEQCCQKTAWQVHAFCLMSNHFHLVVETPQGNLVAGMKWFLSVYTRRFNVRHKVFGHLFSGRYKALPVDGSQSGYLKSVCDYVHLNPERAGLLRPEQPLQTYLWSSYPLYLRQPSSRPAWLRVDRLLGEWGIAWDRPGAADQFAALMEGRRQAEREQQFKPVELRPDWCIGSEQFQKEMLAHVEQNRGQWHYGPELNQSAEAKAERLVVQALAARGVSEDHLMVWRKGHPFKIELAAKLRTETTVTLSWIAQRLAMGTRGHLAHLLYVHQHCPTEDGPAEQPGLEI